jgi:hypothetical protein
MKEQVLNIPQHGEMSVQRMNEKSILGLETGAFHCSVNTIYSSFNALFQASF